jgi:cytoskeletal protein CcmA (bactofilin family)
MFGRRPKQALAPAQGATVVATGSAVEGKLLAKGELWINGAVNGTIEAEGAVTVGPEGRVLGEIEADNLTVAGRVDGIVRVRKHLHVRATGAVQGHARYATLEVERGGVVDGSAARILAGAQQPDNDVDIMTTDAPPAAAAE